MRSVLHHGVSYWKLNILCICIIWEFSNNEIVATESEVATKKFVGLCFCVRLFRSFPERCHVNQFLKLHGTYGVKIHSVFAVYCSCDTRPGSGLVSLQSSGIRCHVDCPVFADVSKEFAAPVFLVDEEESAYQRMRRSIPGTCNLNN